MPLSTGNCVPVHYKIPVYYACQLLSVMKVKETKKIWYILYCKESTTVIKLKFDEEVWKQIFTQLKLLYHVQG